MVHASVLRYALMDYSSKRSCSAKIPASLDISDISKAGTSAWTNVPYTKLLANSRSARMSVLRIDRSRTRTETVSLSASIISTKCWILSTCAQLARTSPPASSKDIISVTTVNAT